MKDHWWVELKYLELRDPINVWGFEGCSTFLEITFQVGLLAAYSRSVGTLAWEIFLSQFKQTYPVYALVPCGPSAADVNTSPELTPKPAWELGIPKRLSRCLAYHLRQRWLSAGLSLSNKKLLNLSPWVKDMNRLHKHLVLFVPRLIKDNMGASLCNGSQVWKCHSLYST